jgi:hypothetical protein
MPISFAHGLNSIRLISSIGFMLAVQFASLSSAYAVQVVREGETVSVSGLETPAGASGQSTQVYPAKRQTNRKQDTSNTNHNVLAATDDMSDFVDPPTNYDDVAPNAEKFPSVDPSPEPIDASVPLDQIPLDKINQNSAPLNTSASNPQWELSRQVSALQQEVSELRGKLEQQTQQISVMEAQQKQRYLDLDSRLEALQGGMSIPVDAQPTVEEPADAAAISPSPSKPVPSKKPLAASSASSNALPMLKSYEAAQQLLKDKKLKSAKQAFTQFIQDYPDEDLTGDAHYWLGEIYLASQPSQEASAKTQFNQVVDSFADSKKVPHALYKLALLEIRGGSKARAKTLLLKLKKDHPSSQPAKLVDAQLKYLKENP